MTHINGVLHGRGWSCTQCQSCDRAAGCRPPQRHAEALREDGRAVRPPEPRPLSEWPGRPGRENELPPCSLTSHSFQLLEKEVRTGRTRRNSFDRRNRLTPLPLPLAQQRFWGTSFAIVLTSNHETQRISCLTPQMNSKLLAVRSGAPLRMAKMPPSPKPLSAPFSLK